MAFAQAMSSPASHFNDPSEYGGHVRRSYRDDRSTETVEGWQGRFAAVSPPRAARSPWTHRQL